jgi:hypothetical protein
LNKWFLSIVQQGYPEIVECKIMAQHFAHNLAGPVGLMLAGFLLIGIGALAVRINKKYITEKK